MDTLEQLENGALAGAREIRLCHYGLTTFPKALYTLCSTLEVLDLSGNALTELPSDLYRFHKLRILFASGNPFTTLPMVLGQMPELEMVGFKACQIAHVPPESLPPRLRWLILTDNHIRELPDALGQRPRLQKLMLSCNQLRSLPDSLARCTRLELLRLASNQFTEIPPCVLQRPHLAWLAMAGNPMTLPRERAVLEAAAPAAIDYAALQLHAQLGEGASGHIWQATDTSLQRQIAVKIFKAAHTSDGTPQSELAAGLHAGQHHSLLTPLASVTGAPQQQLAMALPLLPSLMQPLAQPPSLRSCTRDVYATALRPSPAAVQRVLAQIGSAVRHLHHQGMLHGDLYAHNILWNPATGDAVLSDFGAAMLLGDLAPEQAQALQRMELRALDILRDELYAIAA